MFTCIFLWIKQGGSFVLVFVSDYLAVLVVNYFSVSFSGLV